MEELITIPYEPREQQLTVHESPARFRVVVAHRRFGKTVLAINELLKSALTLDRERPRFAYVAPTFRQAKAVAWDYVRHFCSVVPGVQFNETELRADLPNGAQIRLYGADNPDSLRGIYLDGVVLDEVGMMESRTWDEVLRPLLADRKGWMMAIGTPNGQNLFWRLRQRAATGDGWSLHEFRASKTGIIDPAELADAKQAMSEDAYLQEFECSFEAAVRGAIYGKSMTWLRDNNRLTEIAYEPLLPVITAWDLGISDAMAIVFLQVERSGDVRIIDYLEGHGEGLSWYVNQINAKGYTYSRHVLPHDVEVRELGTGKSRLEMLRSLGLRAEVAPKLTVEDGIEATRVLLRRAWFDIERTQPLIDALMSYRRGLNSRTEEFGSPVHDWASHGCDAVRYAAVALRKSDSGVQKMQPIKYSTAGIV